MLSVILDKNALQGCGSEDDLTALSQKYRIVLPYALIQEIVTEDPSKRAAPHWSSYFRKLKGLRFVVTRNLDLVLKEEERTCLPVSDIDDHRLTRWLREMLGVPFENWQDPRLLARQEYLADSKEFVDYRRSRITSIARRGFPQAAGVIAKTASDKHSLARAWCAVTEPVAYTEWKEHFPLLPRLATRKSFCFMALWLANHADLRRGADGMGSCRGAKDDKLLNEAVDADYLLNLIVKDGIISGEDRVRDTAEAFFPGRKVWKDIRQALACAG